MVIYIYISYFILSTPSQQVYDTIASTEKLLADARLQQQTLDELLARAEAARDIATKAKNKADAILHEGQKTLEILKNFDKEVSESRQKAEDAIDRTKDIEQVRIRKESQRMQAESRRN